MQGIFEVFLKVIKGLNVGVIAGARTTVYAVLVAALFTFARGLLGMVLYLDLKSFLFWLLMATLSAFLLGTMLLIHGARDILFETLLREPNQSSQELFERLLTPIASVLGCLLLFGSLVSRSGGFWRLLREQDFVLALAIGYFLAPTLIRRRLLARLLESLGSA